MVSTRGHKCRFSDGERVLCYEPDPTKAKVLYDSKVPLPINIPGPPKSLLQPQSLVLKVITQKDERGRRNTEYLIHFQGWNSSWDRCVSEDYVLKDTDENRKLQRNLADRAQLQLGAYLYRRERKKQGRILSEESRDGSGSGRINSFSSQDEANDREDEEEREGEEEDKEDIGGLVDDKEDMMTSTDEDKESSTESEDSAENIPIELSEQLKTFLDHDFELINKQHQLIRLPAKPNVVEILESYVHQSGMLQLQSAQQNGRCGRRARPKPQSRGSDADAQTAKASLNVCQEVVDGIRICFDFTLATSLLYSVERPQWEEVQNGREFARVSPKETCDESSQARQAGSSLLKTEPADHGETDRRKSLRSHREQLEVVVGTVAVQTQPQGDSASGVARLTIRNLGHMTDSKEPVNNHCSAQSSSSSSSYCGPLAAHLARPHPQHTNSVLAKVVAANSRWTLVPKEYLLHIPHHPAVVYGATHLARLFVKLPHILYVANQPDKENHPRVLPDRKLKALLHHLHQFLMYLESKTEWFGEKHYTDNLMKPIATIKMESAQ